MKIYSVTDEEFKKFGKVVKGVKVDQILKALEEKTPCPEEAPDYVAEEPELQSLPQAKVLADTLFGGMPTQFGWCNGHNTKLNCFEYHRSSEFNLGTEDFILLLALESDIDENFHIDSSKTMAFKVPAGVLVEVYATSLHYAPCQAHKDKGFKVLVALPQMTNVGNAKPNGDSAEDRLLFARNKWLIAHPEAGEVKSGAFAGIDGENIDIKDLLD